LSVDFEDNIYQEEDTSMVMREARRPGKKDRGSVVINQYIKNRVEIISQDWQIVERLKNRMSESIFAGNITKGLSPIGPNDELVMDFLPLAIKRTVICILCLTAPQN